MRWLRPSRWSLANQFIVVMVLATIGLVLVVGELAAQRDESYLRERVRQQYDQLLDNLKFTASSAIAAEDVSLLTTVVGQLGRSDPSLVVLEILNSEQRTLVEWNRPVAPDSPTLVLRERSARLNGVQQGSIRATVDLSAAMQEVSKRTQDTRIATTTLLLVLALTVSGMIYRLALLPIGELDRRLMVLRGGDLRDGQEINAAAEFRNMGEALNSFARQIRERQALDEAHRLELSDLNRSYLRFVPRQFLEYLHHESIIEVQHGDQVERTMTVLFSDIRAFTTLSESVGAQATFNTLNEFLTRIGPVIRSNNGFIDKYIGDAIMALFDSPLDAINAGNEMLRTLRTLNGERHEVGKAPIRIGIGINTGGLMLGIIGEDLRMEGTVIGDAVNLAARLEGLTKKYGVPLLVTEETVNAAQALLQEPEREAFAANIRLVDAVTAKGRITRTCVYEVFGTDPDEMRALKRHHRDLVDKIYQGTATAEQLPVPTPDGDPLLSVYSGAQVGSDPCSKPPREAFEDVEEEVRWS